MVEGHSDYVVEVVEERIKKLEGRLASAMQKALDIVLSSEQDRLKALEEDMAKIHRHLGLS